MKRSTAVNYQEVEGKTNMHQLCCCQVQELTEAEKIINESIESCHPKSWDENHITYTWLENFRNKFKKIYFPQNYNLRVDWDAYKMSGKLENDNGDIAFIVKLFFDNGNHITGVGFLEAKRINDRGNRYDALKRNQLVKMSKNFSAHQLLLYNYKKQSTMFSSTHAGIIISACDCCHGKALTEFDYNLETNAISVPSAHALHYEDKSNKLSNIGCRLSEQILHRYFYGLDLQFDEEIVEDVISGAKGGTNYIVMAKVVASASSEIDISGESFEPNKDSGFELLKESDEFKGES